jgi:coenzyme Q-binding protein COQ10
MLGASAEQEFIEATMPGFRAKRRVHHSADQMFDLVADVERYHEFVPLCQRHTIASRKKCDDNEILMTDMTVSYQIFRDTHRSRVTLDRVHGRILVESVDGPLRRLRTLWTFQPRGDDSCEVGFDLSYEFSSPMIGLLVGGILDAAFSRFVQAFERRADAIYGRPPAALVSTSGEAQQLRCKNYRCRSVSEPAYPVKVGASPFATDRIDAALDLNQ